MKKWGIGITALTAVVTAFLLIGSNAYMEQQGAKAQAEEQKGGTDRPQAGSLPAGAPATEAVQPEAEKLQPDGPDIPVPTRSKMVGQVTILSSATGAQPAAVERLEPEKPPTNPAPQAEQAAGKAPAAKKTDPPADDPPQGKKFTMNATAYSISIEQTGKLDGITRSGTKVKAGRTVAVDPNIIPLGSLLYIEGMGYRVAEDTGGAIDGYDLDIYMESREECMKFGRRKVYVTLVREGK